MLRISKRQLAYIMLLVSGLCEAHESLDLTESHNTDPQGIEGTTTLSAEDLVELAISTSGIIIVDSRLKGDRQYGHIENSVSLPSSETNCNSLRKLIPSRNTPVVFYCNGNNWERSLASVKVAKNCGYKNIYWFKNGFIEWQSKGYYYIKAK